MKENWDMLELKHGICAFCEIICGCRVDTVIQRCATCEDKYCTLPEIKEWVICRECKKNFPTAGTMGDVLHVDKKES